MQKSPSFYKRLLILIARIPSRLRHTTSQLVVATSKDPIARTNARRQSVYCIGDQPTLCAFCAQRITDRKCSRNADAHYCRRACQLADYMNAQCNA